MAITTTMPWITKKSFDEMASIAVRPIPGRTKTSSTITVPPINRPRLTPARVTREIVALFTRKNLGRLIEQLPAEQKEVVIEHKVKNTPLEELARQRNCGVEVLKTRLQEAFSMVPQLLRKEVLSEIDQVIPPASRSTTGSP